MATYTKTKLFTLPEYKQSKGDRGEVIRQLVNFLGKNVPKLVRNNACPAAILTVHLDQDGDHAVPGTGLVLARYDARTDSMVPIGNNEIYKKVEEWMPRRLDDKYVKVRLGLITRYFRRPSRV